MRRRRLIHFLLALFVAFNVICFFHAYKFTHFDNSGLRSGDPKALSLSDKVRILLTGIDNPRPVNTKVPDVPYKVVYIQSDLHVTVPRH